MSNVNYHCITNTLQDRYQDQSARFDMSPVLSKRDPPDTPVMHTPAPADKPHQSIDTLSTTNPDYSQEKDMAYYLAKIKAKAAQKSQELRLDSKNWP